VLLWAGLAMIWSLPIYLPSAGYLFATDAGRTVVKTAAAGAAAWLAVGLALAPVVGAPAAGIGWCASAAVQLVVLVPRIAARSGAAVAASIAIPSGAATAAAAGGWLAARATGHAVGGGLVGLLAGELGLFAALALLARSALGDTALLVRDAVGNFAARALPRRRPPVPVAEPPLPVHSQIP
jgi:hypothetical protein